jgi:EAL domain-containing protein (putative c-di-GMP-specific phosphodiesterase class I)
MSDGSSPPTGGAQFQIEASYTGKNRIAGLIVDRLSIIADSFERAEEIRLRLAGTFLAQSFARHDLPDATPAKNTIVDIDLDDGSHLPNLRLWLERRPKYGKAIFAVERGVHRQIVQAFAAGATHLVDRPIDHGTLLTTLFGAKSVGVAVAPADGEDADRMLKNADMALSCAKTDGRGTYRFFEPEMDARLQARMSLELDLRSALSRREFEIVYQPIIGLKTNAISGFEALLRWNHPKLGLVMPDQFIRIAEDTEIISSLGEWLLRRACADTARWPKHWKLAVNLSPVQFRSGDLAQSVIAATRSSDLSARRLELEITESVILPDSETNFRTLHQLREAGVGIVMDDFGAGYSSLSYLRKFRFDGIKVDRSLIKELPHNPECSAIVRAVAGIAASLGIGATAEGVETAGQLRQVRQEGFDDAQGFLFGPARTAREIEDFIARSPAGDVVGSAAEAGKVVSTLPVLGSRSAWPTRAVQRRA